MLSKTLKILIVILGVVNFVNTQNYQTIEDIDEVCSQLGFATDEEIQIAVDDIVKQMGLKRNFELRNCPKINNAAAKNIKNSQGEYERYILYDTEFLKRISENSQNDWGAISVLAHEIGHHLNGHALNNKGSNHKWELEADEFSGFVLAKMGATLQEAQSAIQSLTYTKATRTHPAKADRLTQIEKGWRLGGGENIIKPVINNNIYDFEVDWKSKFIQKQYESTFDGLRTPQPSPFGIITQSLVGNTKITIEYSRPSVRGRKIFGDLIPFGKIWRTGANMNTRITFSDDVVIAYQTISAGTYSLYTIPDSAYWTVILYSDAENWGKPREWNNDNIVMQIKVPSQSHQVSTETFLIDFNLLTKKSCEMVLKYDTTSISFNIEEKLNNSEGALTTGKYQKVGLTDFEIIYSNLKNLKKNYNNVIIEKLTFNDDILLANKKIKKGSYQLISKLDSKNYLEFKLIDVAGKKNQLFDNNEPSNITLSNGLVSYSDKLIGNTKIKINITDLKEENAYLQLLLNNEEISIPVHLPTQKKVKSNIASLIAINAAKSSDYYSAAVYYYNNNFNINKAKEWIDKSEDGKDKFWRLHQKSLIYYRYGFKQEAIKIANRAYLLADNAGNVDYKRLIRENLNKW